MIELISPDFCFKKEGRTRAVLLFHGMTGGPSEMKKLGKSLCTAGFDVYCRCLPGHRDHFRDIKQVSWRDWYNFSLSDYSMLKKNYSKVFLAGHCLGAVLALAIAQEHQDVPGIIVLSTTLYLDGWAMPWYNFLLPLGLNTILRYYYSFPESEPYGIKNEALRKKISSLQKRNTAATDHFPLCCTYELLALSRLARANMKKITAPVLIFHAREDDLSGLRSARFVYGHVSSPVKELVILENSYHMVIMDNDSEFVFKKSSEFLNRI